MAPEEHQVQRPTTSRKWTGHVEESRPGIAIRGYLGIAALSQWGDEDENKTEYRSTSSCCRLLGILSILIKPAQFFCLNLLIRLPCETLLPSGDGSSCTESLPEVCGLHKGDGTSGAYGIVGEKRPNSCVTVFRWSEVGFNFFKEDFDTSLILLIDRYLVDAL